MAQYKNGDRVVLRSGVIATVLARPSEVFPLQLRGLDGLDIDTARADGTAGVTAYGVVEQSPNDIMSLAPEGLKVVVGGVYRSRAGDVWTVMDAVDNGEYKFYARSDTNRETYFTAEGDYWENGNEDEDDLIWVVSVPEGPTDTDTTDESDHGGTIPVVNPQPEAPQIKAREFYVLDQYNQRANGDELTSREAADEWLLDHASVGYNYTVVEVIAHVSIGRVITENAK